MKIKKVNIIILFVIIVGIAGIIRFSQKKPQPEEFKGPRETVRIAIPRQPMNSILIIAAELGLFSQEGLDVIAKDGYATGTGKRAGWFGTFVLGCRDDDGNFLPCGMIGTGVKEKEGMGGVTFKQLTELLKPYVEKRHGNAVTIKPKIVAEVAYEEIQKSPTYESGFALRFPRVVRIRDDKSIHDVDSLSRIEILYKQQRGKG